MKLLPIVLLDLVLVAVLLLSPANCEVYYVTPDAAACPHGASPCLTLQEYVNNSSKFLPANLADIEFRFLSGEHSLSKPFVVQGGSRLTFRSANVASVWDSLDVRVKCKNGSYFHFDVATSLLIQGVEFRECGGGVRKGAFTLEVVQDLNVQDVEFVNSNFADIFASDSRGWYNMSNIVGKSMSNHSLGSHIHVEALTTFRVNLINVSLFTNSVDAIVISSNKYDNVSSVTLKNVTTTGNTMHCSVNLGVSFPIAVFGCNFSAHGSVSLCVNTSVSISVANSSFSGSKTGLELVLNPTKGESANQAATAFSNSTVDNCSFSNDGGPGALLITGPVNSNSVVKLINLDFMDNNSTTEFNIISGIVILVDLPLAEIRGLHFTNNRGTPLLLINTTMYAFGENLFIANRAVEGGGIAGSTLVLHNDSVMVFRDNLASNVGGAWYISSEDITLYPLGSNPACFISIYLPHTSPLDLNTLNVSVRFINNTARNGGNVLYGGNIDLCEFDDVSRSTFRYGSDLFSEESIFTYEPKSDWSRLASAPTRVCLCEHGVPNCTRYLYMQGTLYPGQSFPISVVTVGQQFGVVNGTVFGQLLPLANQSSSELDSLQRSQRVGQPECTSLNYSVRSQHPTETIVLTTSIVAVRFFDSPLDRSIIQNYTTFGHISHQLLSMPVFINISLLNCPLGFVLSEELLQCVCDPTIARNGLTCDIDIDNGTVERYGKVWVSFLTNRSTGQEGVVASRQCPNDYCIEAIQHVKLSDPDVQCNFNRSGILCGGCSPGLSLALGSDQCLKCSNVYIALFIPFAVSGVLLVLLIHVLDLTVAVGTINGLIFYANIVKSYELFFFVPGQTNILTVFISWVNLDLGIETCFFNGLDGYTKTWLQFAFPLYLWVLAGLIVFLSRFRKFAKVFAGNAVPVLATMFLLSFNKLFQIAITAHAFSFVTLDLPDGSTLTAWEFDANVLYLSGRHILLFVTSMLIFVLTGLPYLLVLLFYQCLLRVNHKRGCRWVFKLKPFFDANCGHLKDKHLYWVGVMLLARAALLLILVVMSSDGALISVAAVSTFLIVYSDSFMGHVYKHWMLSLLESSFFANLTILSVATYYAKLTRSSQAPVIYTSISIAFLEFAGIVCYHCYKRASTVLGIIRERIRHDYTEISGVDQLLDPSSTDHEVTHSEVHVRTAAVAFREPLLEN